MSLISPRANMRWKEWIPLITQQQRLRNLIQVIAYNINQDISAEEKRKKGKRYYYTLHLTTMSSPFYTSEKLTSENPKWSEFEITNPAHGTATGIVIRVWQNYNNEDTEVTVWGVCFSGLVYIGSQLSRNNPAVFSTNTIVFYMHGGYFTDPQCFKGKSPLVVRLTSVNLPTKDVKTSCTVSLMSKIHEVQQEIKKQTEVAENLRKQILMGGPQLSGTEVREPSRTLRKLLNQSEPQRPQQHEILAVKKDIELVKFRVQLLSQEKSRKLAELRRLSQRKNTLYESNQDKGCELMEKYRELKRDIECTRQWHKQCVETQDALAQASSQLSFRRKRLINELSYIYPITEMSEGKYAICGIHLPNSEDFGGHDETQIAAALGYVAHLVQMIAYFLHVPPRYPIIHFGSRSKIMDHINASMPDKDRQFPLFSRGKDKLQFNYGVYLLNKNIAQLRWYCGISTNDLRTTLPNLASLLQAKLGSFVPSFDLHKRSFSRPPTEVSSSFSPNRQISPQFSLNTGSSLSYSLDKGLDRWEGSGSLSYISSSFQSSSYEDSIRNTVPQMFLQWQGEQVQSNNGTDQHSSLPLIRNEVDPSESNLRVSFPSVSNLYRSLPTVPHEGTIDVTSQNRDSNLSSSVKNSDTSSERAEVPVDEISNSSTHLKNSEDALKISEEPKCGESEVLSETKISNGSEIFESSVSKNLEEVTNLSLVTSEDLIKASNNESIENPLKFINKIQEVNCSSVCNDSETRAESPIEIAEIADCSLQENPSLETTHANHLSTRCGES
nr:PREDICTED: UV radiation resistance-associated gene protein [Bemisia tabaci]